MERDNLIYCDRCGERIPLLDDAWVRLNIDEQNIIRHYCKPCANAMKRIARWRRYGHALLRILRRCHLSR
jgi:hypothetical protein